MNKVHLSSKAEHCFLTDVLESRLINDLRTVACQSEKRSSKTLMAPDHEL